MNTIYIVQYYTGGIISVHFNEEDAEEVLLKFNVEDDDGEVVAYVEQWEVE